ncbi:MAG: O-antigen ligase family protein [Chloroflexi bacterium]|nr:O-antigen ligase family protein [Chloroflexota bacterium]
MIERAAGPDSRISEAGEPDGGQADSRGARPVQSAICNLQSAIRHLPSVMRPFWPWLPILWGGAALAAWVRLGEPALFVALGLAIVWVIGLLSGLGPAVRTPLDWPLTFIVLWLPVNYWASADKASSIPAAANLLAGVAVFYLVVAVAQAGRRPRWPFYAFLLAGAALLCVIVLVPEGMRVRLPLPGPVIALARRLGETVNANVLAGALLPAAVIAAGLALGPGKAAFRVACGFLVLAAIVVMALGTSRGALLGLGAGVLVVLLALGPRHRIVALVLVMAAGVAAWRIGPTTLLESLGTGGAAGSLSGRLEIWSRALYALQDFVFTGIGIGTFHLVIPLLYPYFTVGFDTPIPHAHNHFLQVGADLGLPGLWAYVTITILSSGLLIVAMRRRAARRQRYQLAAILGALVAVWTHGLFDAVLWDTKPAFLLWWLFGLAITAFFEE